MYFKALAFLEELGLSHTISSLLAYATVLTLLLAACFLANLIAKRLILRLLRYMVRKSKNKWDDALMARKVFERLSHLAPALIIFLYGDLILNEGHHPDLVEVLKRTAMVYTFLIGASVVSAFLNAAADIYQGFEISKNRPVKGYIQALKIFLYLIVAILVISSIIDQSPKLLLSGLGALTAVILLIFKDSILGFVASIQLASNQMIRPGDWITVPKAHADGDVVDVSLTTVKVQNWDKTITSVPIYSLISDSFTNWRGMAESGGRRIKRSINIEMSSIRFCDKEMLDKFENIRLIADYIKGKKKELADYRREKGIADEDNVNGPQLTNIGTFRQYIGAYLRGNPLIHQDMTLLVRYLAPTPQGLPIEIYVFSKDQRWAYYENIQADIFDHLLAVVPEFGLRVFQNPSGNDMRAIQLRGEPPRPESQGGSRS